MGLTIRGTVTAEDDRQGIADLLVEAYDADLFKDDLLGSARTDATGAFAIACPTLGPLAERPDVYLSIKSSGADLLHSTRNRIVKDVHQDLTLDVILGPAALAKIGRGATRDATVGTDPARNLSYKTWTFRADSDLASPLLAQVYHDLEERGSILELFRDYKETLDRSADNDDPVYHKLATLFARCRPARCNPVAQ